MFQMLVLFALIVRFTIGYSSEISSPIVMLGALVFVRFRLKPSVFDERVAFQLSTVTEPVQFKPLKAMSQ